MQQHHYYITSEAETADKARHALANGGIFSLLGGFNDTYWAFVEISYYDDDDNLIALYGGLLSHDDHQDLILEIKEQADDRL